MGRRRLSLPSGFHWEQLQCAMDQIRYKGIAENIVRDGLLGVDSAAVERLTFAWHAVVYRERASRNSPSQGGGRKGAALNGFMLYQLLRNCWDLGLLPAWTVALVDLLGLHVAVESFGKREIGLGASALYWASHYYQTSPSASDSELADATGVSRRQIARWRKAGYLQTGPIPSLLQEQECNPILSLLRQCQQRQQEQEEHTYRRRSASRTSAQDKRSK